MAEINSVLSGVAGEYYVAAELSKRGYLASITLRNTKGVDILCSDQDARKSVGIQVKTSKGKQKSWILNQKCENYFAENLFYVFVGLNDREGHPDFYIVPSKIVAEYAKSNHQNWLSSPGKKGQQRNDTSMRKFDDAKGTYKDRWDLLGLEVLE